MVKIVVKGTKRVQSQYKHGVEEWDGLVIVEVEIIGVNTDEPDDIRYIIYKTLISRGLENVSTTTRNGHVVGWGDTYVSPDLSVAELVDILQRVMDGILEGLQNIKDITMEVAIQREVSLPL